MEDERERRLRVNTEHVAAAAARAAGAHRRAAGVESRAANLLTAAGDAEAAERHRRRAQWHAALAENDYRRHADQVRDSD